MKKLFFTAFCALSLIPASAQEDIEEVVEYSTDKYKVETNHFWNNWFVSVGGGAQIYFGDHDKQCDFGDRLAPAFDIAVGKWFSPEIGVRLMYSGHQIKGATKHPGDPNEDSAHGTGDPVKGGGAPHWLEKQKFDMFNLHADVLFNLSNIICGYNEKRIWNCSPYLGVGWGRVWDAPQQKEVTANIGVFNSFRLCSVLDANIDVRGMFVNDRFDGEGGGRFGEGLLTATVGLTYKFGKDRTWSRSKTVVRYDNTALNAMRRQLDEMSAENERLKQLLAAGNQKEAEVVVKKIAAANLVTFQIGKHKLSNEARANLGLLAEVIKQGDKSAVYTVTGYCDRGTGTKKFNEWLSKKRAQAVCDCLVDEFGVPESQLRVDYKGGVDNMFYNDPRLSRAVITRGE